MEHIKENWKWFLAVFLILIALIIFLGPRYIDFLSYLNRFTGSSSENFRGANTEVKPSDDFVGQVIHYTDQGFSTPQLFMKQDYSGLGCLLQIKNKSGDALVLRLGPYPKSLQNNYGQQYESLPSGESMIIDPRYGRTQEEFLNLSNPEQKFSVKFDSSCQTQY